MAAEKFFNRLAENVLQASENVANRMEEGISVLTSGGLAGSSSFEPTKNDEVNLLDGVDLTDPDFEGLNEEDIKNLLAEEMMDSSPLGGIAESVISDIVSGQAGPSTPMEHFEAFRSAITWSESFLLTLVGFQVLMFFICLWVSRKDRGLTLRVIVLVFIAVVVRSAETLNDIGAHQWEKFATQNYFDKRGVFVGIMLCSPLLVDCLVMLLLFVREASQLLVEVKRKEIKKKNGDKAQKKRKSKDD